VSYRKLDDFRNIATLNDGASFIKDAKPTKSKF